VNKAMKVVLSVGIGLVLVSCMAGKCWSGDPPADPAVECSWTCHCAKSLEDCDETESQWDLCLDTKRTVHPDKVESCEKCAEVAKAACAKRTCPPDPNKGPKHVFQYFCDGRKQPLASSDIPRSVDDALLVSPSVGLPLAVERGERLFQESGAAKLEDTVTCKYRCGCSANTGKCDSQEDRSQMCVDKDDKTIKAGAECWQCEIKARLACWKQKCPLAGQTTKVLTSFECP
jgi:hypothetical protein